MGLIFWNTTRSDFRHAPPGWRGNLACSTPEGGDPMAHAYRSRLTGETVSPRDAGYGMGFHTEPAFSADGRLVAVGVDGHLLEFDATAGTLLPITEPSMACVGGVHSIDYANNFDSWVLSTSNGLQLHQRTSPRTNPKQDTIATE